MDYLFSEIIEVEQALLKIKNGNLYSACLEFFKAMDYPVSPLKQVVNMEIKQFIYLNLEQRVYFSIEEHDYLKNINSISTLFEVNTNKAEADITFFNKILFLAIDLSCQKDERSQHAHSITKIINKGYNHTILIVFHHNDWICFSGLIYEIPSDERSAKVYLSDWYNCEEIGKKTNDKLHSLTFANQSNNSIKELYYDILFAIARDYYIYPESFEYLAFGYLIRNTTEPLNERVYYKNKQEISEEKYHYYIQVYGDDFITEDEGLEVLLAEDDIFIDEFLDFDTEEDDFSLQENEEYDEDITENEINQQEENNLPKNISAECFEDPIKMLEWFSKIEENED